MSGEPRSEMSGKWGDGKDRASSRRQGAEKGKKQRTVRGTKEGPFGRTITYGIKQKEREEWETELNKNRLEFNVCVRSNQ